MTFEDVLATAYKTNPQLEAQRATVRSTDETVAKALAGWRPTISVDGTIGTQWQRDVPTPNRQVQSYPQFEAATVTQPLFSGQTEPNILHAKAAVASARAQLLLAEENVLLAAATAYRAVLRDQAIVALAREDVANLRVLLDNIAHRQQLGELTKTDTSQAKARLLGAMISLTAAEHQLAASRADFEHVVGRPAETLQTSDITRFLPHVEDAALAVALHQNPALLQARADAWAADYAVDAAIGALLPTVSVRAQVSRSVDNLGPGVRDGTASVTAQVSIPIYQGGGEEAAVRQAREARTAATLNIYEAERQVREAVQVAWDGYDAARRTSGLSGEQTAANVTAFEGSRMESLVGERNTIDILNADQELLQSRIANVTALYDSDVAAYQLLVAEGLFTAKGLHLPTPLYDPRAHYDDDAERWFGLGG